MFKTKSELRLLYLNKRNSLPKKLLLNYSNRITSNLLESELFYNISSIGIYFSIGSEANTHCIINESLSRSKIVLLPKIENKKNELNFYHANGRSLDDIQLSKGKYGILEPVNDEVYTDTIDLLLLPGIVFDMFGNRIGYGKGFYDNFLKKKRSKINLGVCFENQILDESIPSDEFDEKVDGIITENRILFFKSF